MCASRCASHKECGIKSIWMSSFRVWSLFRASDMFVTLCLCMCVGVWCGVVCVLELLHGQRADHYLSYMTRTRNHSTFFASLLHPKLEPRFHIGRGVIGGDSHAFAVKWAAYVPHVEAVQHYMCMCECACVPACVRVCVCVCERERERDWDIDDLLYTSQMTFHNERKSDPLYKAISWTTNTKKWNRNQMWWIPRHSPAHHECISQISVLVLTVTWNTTVTISIHNSQTGLPRPPVSSTASSLLPIPQLCDDTVTRLHVQLEPVDNGTMA